MSAYLIDHPPLQRQFRPRGTTVSGVIVVHTAENAPDWAGEDAGAEGVARFIQQRSDFGSYHWLADSDTRILLVPMTMQAYGDGTGSNPHAIHISAATKTTAWAAMSPTRRKGFLTQMAKAAVAASAFVHSVHGVHVPARRITRAQSEARVEGFISHAERDPARRSDPGKDFPWQEFLSIYKNLQAPPDPDPTRGPNVDKALTLLSASLNALEDAKGAGVRGRLLEEATWLALSARRTLRRIALLNDQET